MVEYPERSDRSIIHGDLAAMIRKLNGLQSDFNQMSSWKVWEDEEVLMEEISTDILAVMAKVEDLQKKLNRMTEEEQAEFDKVMRGE